MYDFVVGIFFFLVYDPCVSSVGRRFVKRACLVAPGIVCIGGTVNGSSILAFGLCYPALVVVGERCGVFERPASAVVCKELFECRFIYFCRYFVCRAVKFLESCLAHGYGVACFEIRCTVCESLRDCGACRCGEKNSCGKNEGCFVHYFREMMVVV